MKIINAMVTSGLGRSWINFKGGCRQVKRCEVVRVDLAFFGVSFNRCVDEILVKFYLYMTPHSVCTGTVSGSNLSRLTIVGP